MSIFILPFIHYLCFIFYAVAAAFIVYKDKKSPVNIFCAIFISCFAIWSFGMIFIHNPNTSKEMVDFWYSINSLGWVSFSYFFLLFSQAYIDDKKLFKHKWIYLSLFIFPLIIIVRKFSGGMFVDYIHTYYGWNYFWENNWWTYSFYIYYVAVMLFSILILLIFGLKTEYQIKKKQVKIMLIAVFFALPLGSLTNVILPEIEFFKIPPLANVFTLVWVMGVAYSILKYNFLNINPKTAAENIISRMSDAFFLLNKDGKIIKVNEAAAVLTGYKKDGLKNKKINLFFKENDFFKLFYEEIKYGNSIENYETTIVAKKKKKSINVIFSSSLIKDENDQLIGIVCIAKNISDIKKMESDLELKNKELNSNMKELKKSENEISLVLADLEKEKKKSENEREKNFSILASFNDPIFFIDNSGKIGLYNPAAINLFEIADDLVGAKISIADEYSFENFKKVLKKDFKINKIYNDAGQKLYEELDIETSGKQVLYKVISTEVLDNNNTSIGCVKVFYDLTREKEIDKIKSEFISIAAHQLRTPLSAIKWVVKMILDEDVGKLNEEQRDLLEKGYKSNERIIQLVNDLLNVSRIEEGRFNFNYMEHDFQNIINATVENEESFLAKKHIKFQINKPGNLPMVYVDKEKISLVLQNLLENAIKYSPSHGKIDIKIKKREDHLLVSIADNGVGIPKEDVPHLFTKFFRAKNAVRMQTEGSGLGLFIVKNIIEKHNGKIMVKSKEGSGTEISFTIPIKKVKII
jgi:PAS domain S-box-containing protein